MVILMTLFRYLWNLLHKIPLCCSGDTTSNQIPNSVQKEVSIPLNSDPWSIKMRIGNPFGTMICWKVLSLTSSLFTCDISAVVANKVVLHKLVSNAPPFNLFLSISLCCLEVAVSNSRVSNIKTDDIKWFSCHDGFVYFLSLMLCVSYFQGYSVRTWLPLL
jgi:hypothetical protein